MTPPSIRTSIALAWAGVALFVGSLVGEMGFGLIAGIGAGVLLFSSVVSRRG